MVPDFIVSTVEFFNVKQNVPLLKKRCGVEIHFAQFCEIFTVLTFVSFTIRATVNYAKHCQISTKQLFCHFLLFVEAV